tara:strand:+ start:2544 stop:5009 length:2466 start_codon:yes stop_codon:yes gene_type:complete
MSSVDVDAAFGAFQKQQQQSEVDVDDVWKKFTTNELTESIDKITGGPGLEDFGVRAEIRAFYRPQTAAEANSVFRKTYPDGEIIRDPDDKQLYFRIGKDDDFRKLDPDMISDSGRLRDLPFDIAEFAAREAPVLLGESAAFLTPNPISVLGGATRAFLGGGTGELVRQLSQVLSGKKEPEGMFEEAAKTGSFAAGGQLVAQPFIRGVQMLRGRKLNPAMAIDPTAGRAIAGETRQNLLPVSPGQIVINPIVKKLEVMGRQFSPSMIEFFQSQKNEGVKKFRNIASDLDEKGEVVKEAPVNLSVALRNATDEAEQQIFRPLSKQYPNYKDMTSAQAGKQILGGVVKWDELARRQVNAAYNEARQAATPKYDVTNMKSAAKVVLSGVKIATKPQLVAGKILDQYGDPIPKTVVEKRRVGKLNKEVKEAAQLIRDMDTNLPVVNGDDATEQLSKLRNTLWDAKTPAVGDVIRQENRDALVLYNALTKVMDNPIVDAGDTQGLWKKAAQLASRRFAVLDKAVIGQIIRTKVKGGESQLARSLVSAGKQSDIDDLKSLLPKGKFDSLRTFVAGELVRDPTKIKSMDGDVLNSLFGPRQIQDFQSMADDVAKLRTSEMAQIFADNISNRQATLEFLKKAQPAQMDAFIKTVKSSPAIVKEIKTTILDAIGNASYDKNKKFNFDQFSNAINDLRDRGLFRKNGLWTPKEMQAINDFRGYFNRIAGPSSQDAGVSLMAAQVISPAQFGRGEKSVSTIAIELMHQIALTAGLGKILLSRPVSKFLRGQAQKKNPRTGEPEVLSSLGTNQLRGFIAAATAAAFDEQEEEIE